jgi:hypothetical protein
MRSITQLPAVYGTTLFKASKIGSSVGLGRGIPLLTPFYVPVSFNPDEAGKGRPHASFSRLSAHSLFVDTTPVRSYMRKWRSAYPTPTWIFALTRFSNALL